MSGLSLLFFSPFIFVSLPLCRLARRGPSTYRYVYIHRSSILTSTTGHDTRLFSIFITQGVPCAEMAGKYTSKIEIIELGPYARFPRATLYTLRWFSTSCRMGNNCIRRVAVWVYIECFRRESCATDAIRDLSSSHQYNTHGRTVWSVVWAKITAGHFPPAE